MTCRIGSTKHVFGVMSFVLFVLSFYA